MKEVTSKDYILNDFIYMKYPVDRSMKIERRIAVPGNGVTWAWRMAASRPRFF